MLLRTPEVTSAILEIMAEGVRGGVRRRRESVVVCDLRSVVVDFITSRGFVVSFDEEELATAFEEEEEEGAREFWKCAKRPWVLFVRSIRDCMLGALFASLALEGIAVNSI